jgi:hypothetical protein
MDRLLTVLEPLLESAVDLVDAFLLALVLELVEALGHLLADLLGGLEVGHELLLVDLVLSFQERSQSIIKLKWQFVPKAALLEVRLLPVLEVGEAAADNGALNNALLFLLPHGLVTEVIVPADVVGEASHFLYRYYKY